MVPARVERFAGRQVQHALSSCSEPSPLVVMVRASRAAVLALAVVVPLLSACREVSQPALDGTAGRDVLVPVEQNGAWGYITGRGTLAIPPRFERAYRFVNNRALVRRDGRYGFIDTSGAAVIPPTFAAAASASGRTGGGASSTGRARR